MKTILYIAILFAALVMVPMLSNVVTAQAPGFDREQCLQNCSWLKPWGGNNYGQYMNYSNCVAGCESRFWKEFDRNTDRLKNKIDEPD
jgi:hypothetical protein